MIIVDLLTLSSPNYNVMKCLSTELLLFFFKTVITDVALCGLPGGLLLAPPAVKELSTIIPRLTFKALNFFLI